MISTGCFADRCVSRVLQLVIVTLVVVVEHAGGRSARRLAGRIVIRSSVISWIKALTRPSDFKYSDCTRSREMGGICSKSSTLTGGHTLAPPSTIDNSGRPQQRGPRQHPQSPEDRRTQAAAAAERRVKAENKRGVTAANPNSGRLAARLEASKSAPPAPEPTRREDTLIDDWRN